MDIACQCLCYLIEQAPQLAYRFGEISRVAEENSALFRLMREPSVAPSELKQEPIVAPSELKKELPPITRFQ